MVKKRGQVALEFLSTYGFAFLIILVMIGALSYFGILNPSKFLPGRCLISNEFSCTDDLISSSGSTLNVMLVNQLGNTITFTNDASMNATSTYGNGPCKTVPVTANTTVSGQNVTIQCTLSPGVLPPPGQKAKIEFAVAYTTQGGAYAHIAQGEVADTVQ